MRDAVAYSYSNRDSDRNPNCNINSYCDSDTYTYFYTNTYTDGDGNGYSNTHDAAYSVTKASPDSGAAHVNRSANWNRCGEELAKQTREFFGLCLRE